MLGRAVQDSRFSTDKSKASGETPADESAEVQPPPASDCALITAAYLYLHESGQLPIAEHNEVYVSRPELMGAVRDAISKSTLGERLKAAGQHSARVKPVRAKDRAMIAQAYDSAVVREKMPAENPDRALIAEAYQYLQESGQLSPAQPDVIVCVHSSDEVHDFFVANGVESCKDDVCKFLGIESAEDLKLITANDLLGSRFSTWADGSITIVQHKKLIKAFS
jgi:hypothetical protein